MSFSQDWISFFFVVVVVIFFAVAVVSLIFFFPPCPSPSSSDSRLFLIIFNLFWFSFFRWDVDMRMKILLRLSGDCLNLQS